MVEIASDEARNVTILQVEEFITKSLLPLAPTKNGKAGRKPIVPALALWSGMLICILRGMGSQLALWRLLTNEGVWSFDRYDVDDDAVYKRLKRASTNTFSKIFAQISELLAELAKARQLAVGQLAPFAQGVFALDAMTLDRVKKCLPELRKSEEAVLPGRMLALFDVRAQLWKHLEFIENALENEKAQVRLLLPHIPTGSLILADMGFFSFEWFDELTDKGYFWVSRLRAKTSYETQQTLLSQNGVLDAIIWLGMYRADRAKHAVRLIEFELNGKRFSYITNVLDPKVLSVADVARLYARRWDIEMMFNLVKTHLKLHMIWSGHQNVVLHQVYAVFTVAQIILGLRSEIAYQTCADPFEVSLDLLVKTLPRLMERGIDPVQFMREYGRKGKYIRPTTRTQIKVPDFDLSAYIPLLDSITLIRQPRYAHKL
jgi:Transposase DDE domain